MRKRHRAGRPRDGQEEMWLRVPEGSVEPTEPEVAGPTRAEEPTYEDPWYQVLRRRLEERASSSSD